MEGEGERVRGRVRYTFVLPERVIRHPVLPEKRAMHVPIVGGGGERGREGRGGRVWLGSRAMGLMSWRLCGRLGVTGNTQLRGSRRAVRMRSKGRAEAVELHELSGGRGGGRRREGKGEKCGKKEAQGGEKGAGRVEMGEVLMVVEVSSGGFGALQIAARALRARLRVSEAVEDLEE